MISPIEHERLMREDINYVKKQADRKIKILLSALKSAHTTIVNDHFPETVTEEDILVIMSEVIDGVKDKRLCGAAFEAKKEYLPSEEWMESMGYNEV